MTQSPYQPKKCDGFQIEELDGEVVLFHPARNVIIHANQSAALIWQLCDGTRTTDEISALLANAYPENRQEIEKEVPETIQDLRKKGALEGG